MREELNQLQLVNPHKSGFKKRQYTTFVVVYIMIVFAFLVGLGIWRMMDEFSWVYVWQFGIAAFVLLTAFVKYFKYNVLLDTIHIKLYLIILQSMMWSEIEDEGETLSVKFGPLNLWCGMGNAIIPFDQVKSYRLAHEACGKCGYGVGKVNFCVPGGLRQHALCSLCCSQKPILIEFKEKQSICGKGYKLILIAVERRDYQEFMRMMDEKFGVISNTTTDI